MPRIFIRIVDDEKDLCVDMVGECEQVEVSTVSEQFRDHRWPWIPVVPVRSMFVRIFPDRLPISGLRLSTSDAAINWETAPGEIPSADNVIFGRLKP